MTLPPELRARVLGAVRAERSPVRAEVVRRSVLLAASAALVIGAAFYALGGADLGERPEGFMLATELGWLALAGVATAFAFVRGSSMLGRPRGWLLAVAWAGPVAFWAWSVLWNARYPTTLGGFHVFPTFCFTVTLAVGAWPLVALSLARRNSDPVHPRATGAALGVAAGAWTGAMMDLCCPAANPWHVALGHLLPILMLAALGAALGQRIVAVRSPGR